MQGSTVSNLKFQCMAVHFSVNKVIFISSENVFFCICGEFYCTTLFKTNLHLKHIEFLLRLMVTMLVEDRSQDQTLAELEKTLQVDEATVSKRLKVLGMIQK